MDDQELATAGNDSSPSPLAGRFRAFMPIVVDVETSGFNARTDAILQIAATPVDMTDAGVLVPGLTHFYEVEPFAGANIETASLDFTGIDPDDPERGAIAESDALRAIFQEIRRCVRAHGCTRAVLVGHNATFDHGFVMAAAERCNIKRNPFHPFSTFDTVTLAALAYGQTVLAKACQVAGIEFDNSAAHRADYDAAKTAELFCAIVNRWQDLGGWPLPLNPS